MSNITVSNTSTSAITLGADTLTVTSTGFLKPSGPAVTWTESSTASVIVAGKIAPTSGRAFDTTGTGTSSTSFTLTNQSTGQIIGASDVMRIQKGGFSAF